MFTEFEINKSFKVYEDLSLVNKSKFKAIKLLETQSYTNANPSSNINLGSYKDYSLYKGIDKRLLLFKNKTSNYSVINKSNIWNFQWRYNFFLYSQNNETILKNIHNNNNRNKIILYSKFVRFDL